MICIKFRRGPDERPGRRQRRRRQRQEGTEGFRFSLVRFFGHRSFLWQLRAMMSVTCRNLRLFIALLQLRYSKLSANFTVNHQTSRWFLCGTELSVPSRCSRNASERLLYEIAFQSIAVPVLVLVFPASLIGNCVQHDGRHCVSYGVIGN